ncbi:hypothetical protein DER44DRAFT_832618 [Fusarium oxysporum]|nr:hypothetical protein DER44DRAFT_832618 [Fusarium oxysporum]
MRHTREGSVTAREWIDAIANQMAEAGIDWVPGYYRKRLTSRRVIQLDKVQRYKRPVVVLTGPPNSLKRVAKEAELRMAMTAGGEPAAKQSRKRKIDIGCEVPFKKVPQTIQEGFENRGFNNRGLLKLGWVEYNSKTGTRRRTPRTTELKLKSIEELYDNRKRLVSAMNNAEKFISLVFGSDDEV